MGGILENFLAMYQRLDSNNLELLSTMYTPKVVFIDPVHRLEGLQALQEYFTGLYANLTSITFEYHDVLKQDQRGFVSWTLGFTHRKMPGKGVIEVEGVSYLRFAQDGLVCFHRDYFDLGQLVYEQLPLLGVLIKKIKARMQQ